MTPAEIIRAVHRATGGPTMLLDEHDADAARQALGDGFALLSESGIDPSELWLSSRTPFLNLAVAGRPRTARDLFRVLSLVEPMIAPGGTILLMPYTPPDGGAENRVEATEVYLGVHPDWAGRLLDANVVELRKRGAPLLDEKPDTGDGSGAPPVLVPRRRVISLSVFNDGPYWQYLGAFVRAHHALFPRYELRIHHDEAIFRTPYGGSLFGLAAQGLVRLVYMPSRSGQGKCERMLHRLAPAWDSDAEYVFARDLDALPTWTERRAVEEFIASGLELHTIHANPAHCGIMGGLCGVSAAALRRLAPTFEEFVALAKFSDERWAEHGADQDHLNNHVAPHLSVFEHSLIEQYREDGQTRLYRKPQDWAGGGKHHVSERFATETTDLSWPDVAAEAQAGADGLIAYPGVAGYDHAAATVFYDRHCPVIEAIRVAEHDAGELPNGQRIEPSQPRAILATDTNHDYAFFAPLTCALWSTRMGYRPLLFLVGDVTTWMGDLRLRLAVEGCRRFGAEIVFTGEFNGFATSTIAQVSRLFAASVDGIADDAFLLTSDVDMWPLGGWIGGLEHAPDRVYVYGANAYANEKTPHVPICYLGAAAKVWREIMGSGTFRGEILHAMAGLSRHLTAPGAGSATTRSWFFDERHFGERLAEWSGYPSRCVFIPREFKAGDWRIDRSDWQTVRDLDGIADAHLLRPGYGEHWHRLRHVLALAMPAAFVEWADSYREAWVNG